ncbi:hypothetical protein [Croceitalea rosinachiae]|uniref:Uncharacterized protein n=1 Tax=Croceitalea rosinachiae TaxID=3075596 RepID=A0ABU3A5R8_9FLAO|nr:hypothetical protein [Croceitalea sp. F388]MDT0605511.1 hypothetical protein [Croceitalea sp. F388]
MNLEQVGQLPQTFYDQKGVPKWRWYLMKIFYGFIFIAFGYQIWTTILTNTALWDPMEAVAFSFWAAYATLMGLGIRYPLKMLPLLLLQLFYKTVWLLIAYLPLKAAGNLDETALELYKANSMGIVLDILIIPWGYVYKSYIKKLLKFR